MATQPRSSPNALLQPNARRRVSTLNFGMLLIIVGFVGAIILVIVYGVSRMNATPPETMVNGGPVTQGASPQDLGMTGPSSTTFQPDVPAQPATARQYAAPAATPAPVQPRAQAASSSGSSSADNAAAEASSQRREAARRAADAEHQRLEQRRERMDSAMRSLSSVAVAAPPDSSKQDNLANPASAVSNATTERQYAAPSGPILALDTSIPIALTRSIDSTFSGQFPVDITADVLDETGASVVIPRGSRCFATSSAGGVDGQDRIYGSVNLCKLPDRSRLVLDNFPIIDADGATGMKARVDDHGAGRRNRGSALSSLPGMLVGTVVPGVASGVASSAMYAAQSGPGRAIPGPTLYVDASPQKPRTLSILVTADVAVHPYTSEIAR